MDKQFSEFLCAVSETVRNYHDIIINCGNKEHGNFELLFFSLSPNPNVEKVCQWEGHLCQCLFSHTSQKAQLRAPLSPLQTAWTGFDPYSYSGGSSSAGPAQVEIVAIRYIIRVETGHTYAHPVQPCTQAFSPQLCHLQCD